jgi:hypothetical protein
VALNMNGLLRGCCQHIAGVVRKFGSCEVAHGLSPFANFTVLAKMGKVKVAAHT